MSEVNPQTERTKDGYWRCKSCGEIGWCYCEEDGAADPICDCGWVGWICRCEDKPNNDLSTIVEANP